MPGHYHYLPISNILSIFYWTWTQIHAPGLASESCTIWSLLSLHHSAPACSAVSSTSSLLLEHLPSHPGLPILPSHPGLPILELFHSWLSQCSVRTSLRVPGWAAPVAFTKEEVAAHLLCFSTSPDVSLHVSLSLLCALLHLLQQTAVDLIWSSSHSFYTLCLLQGLAYKQGIKSDCLKKLWNKKLSGGLSEFFKSKIQNLKRNGYIMEPGWMSDFLFHKDWKLSRKVSYFP